MPINQIPIQTHLVLWGLPSSGKDFLTALLKQRFPGAFSFGMGDEFRSIPTDGPSPFGELVDTFVRERMPAGDLAPLDVYTPVFDAAWRRQNDDIKRSKLCLYNGVVRTMPQWYHFRARLSQEVDQTHRVIVLCLDRPEDLCLRLWQKGQGADRAGRPDDAGGEEVFRRRVRIAREEWHPLQERLESASTADFVRVVVPGQNMEDGLDRIIEALDLNTPRPSVATSSRHELLAAAPSDGPPGCNRRVRLTVNLAA